MIHKSVNEYGVTIYKNEKGQFHREDGPTYECLSGHKEWRLNDILHREDGPAVIFSDGDEWYYLNGTRFEYKEEYEQEIAKIKLKKILDL